MPLRAAHPSRPSCQSRPSRVAPRGPALTAAAVLVLALAGCGGGEQDPDDEPTAEQGSSSVSTSATPEPEQVDPQVLQDAVDATLAARAFTVEADLTLQLGDQQLGLRTEGSVDYDAVVADVLLAVDQSGQANEVEIRSDGDLFWVRPAGAGAPQLPEGRTWIQGEADRLADATTFEPSGLLGSALVLRGAGEVEELGTEEEDGVEVTRYATTFTYADAQAAVQGTDEAPLLQSAFSLTGAATTLELDTEVAVGEDGVIRDLDLEIAETDLPASGGVELSLDDVGGEVPAPTRPPAEEVLLGAQASALLDRLIT